MFLVRRLLVKRISLLVLSLIILGLSSCAPKAKVENNVVPTIFSIKVDGRTMTIQGRYFDDGQGGKAQASYVIVGGDVNGNGGYTVKASSWSAGKIIAQIPAEAHSGFVFVVVNGIKSNGLPANY